MTPILLYAIDFEELHISSIATKISINCYLHVAGFRVSETPLVQYKAVDSDLVYEKDNANAPFPNFFAFYDGPVKASVDKFLQRLNNNRYPGAVVAFVVGDQKSGKTTMGKSFFYKDNLLTQLIAFYRIK